MTMVDGKTNFNFAKKSNSFSVFDYREDRPEPLKIYIFPSLIVAKAY